jgi:hypothetical protein
MFDFIARADKLRDQLQYLAVTAETYGDYDDYIVEARYVQKELNSDLCANRRFRRSSFDIVNFWERRGDCEADWIVLEHQKSLIASYDRVIAHLIVIRDDVRDSIKARKQVEAWFLKRNAKVFARWDKEKEAARELIAEFSDKIVAAKVAARLFQETGDAHWSHVAHEIKRSSLG